VSCINAHRICSLAYRETHASTSTSTSTSTHTHTHTHAHTLLRTCLDRTGPPRCRVAPLLPRELGISKKLFTLLDLGVSSLRRGHANLLCIVPILTDDPRRESESCGDQSPQYMVLAQSSTPSCPRRPQMRSAERSPYGDLKLPRRLRPRSN
jgi:hypothetical protein